ncbi:PEP motif putative anchor domain protein [Solidesulfovibrio carbinoliphilus subsp. oakridgensis]|uniref:PEP motif putative anchor domain protein n=1 Tax=Solidesulfovibrio carbinoliphilus subsp. oakridgensis TaxID=694327 RepID=G7Q640_9BACT|nr:PEP-CTERM sorting domain-containing protein [Solidesulfovibrio carbinoliphilus]EHJ47056.1 PEP motif putative anchor domain protein [Solidesulfovibrio carbinoliphilus subsp. oakridgensis]
MKRFILSICLALSIIALGTISSHAFVVTGDYSDTVDFYSSGTYDGRTYQLIGDNPDFSYTHSVDFAYPAVDVTSAFLTLTYSQVDSSWWNPAEVWVVQAGNSKTQIGTLDSTSGWKAETFNIPYALYSSIAGSTWNLLITFDETTGGSDSFKLDKSVLSGCYTYDPCDPGTVPEPATMLLLGTGMIGLLGSRKRFMKKA